MEFATTMSFYLTDQKCLMVALNTLSIILKADTFYCRWLKNSVIEIRIAVSITLMLNLLDWNLSDIDFEHFNVFQNRWKSAIELKTSVENRFKMAENSWNAAKWLKIVKIYFKEHKPHRSWGGD